MKNYLLIFILVFISLFSFQLKGQVVADFDFQINSGCPNQVMFVNTTIGSYSMTFWDFGNGPNPGAIGDTIVHTFDSIGLNVVRMGVVNSGLQLIDSISKNVNISSLATLNIDIDKRNNCIGSQVCSGELTVTNITGTPPYQYIWSNGEVNTNGISNLCNDIYTVTVTDDFGCMFIKSEIVSDSNNLSVDIVNISQTSCGYCNGKIDLDVPNPSHTFYSWSNGSKYQDLINVCPARYSVTVTDTLLSCMWSNDSIVVSGNSSCFDTITGRAFVDYNSNCAKDYFDIYIPNLLIDVSPGGGVLTNQDGYYEYVSDTGTFTVSSVHNLSIISLLCPLSGQYNVNFTQQGQISDSNDFAFSIIPIQDLSTSIFCGVTRPGFQQNISFTVSNDGTIPSDGVAAFQLDSLLTFLNSTGGTLAPDSIDANSNTIYWSFDTLNMFETITFTFLVQTPPPPTLNFGDLISNSISIITSTESDVTFENNSSTCDVTVTGSYDPNDKAVTPSGEGEEGNITQQDTLMHYRIRFQNTGNDTAFTVLIRDTLDTDLDWGSFKKGTSSHPYEVHFEEDDILVFTFNNILLPDSNVNEPASHGHVTFYMEHNGILPLGTEIENRAAIYFDFNPPIITNTVRNKIYKPVGVEELNSLDINLYPNPTENQIVVDAGNENIQRLIVTDISGKQLMDVQSLNTQKHQLNLHLESGIYLVQVYTAKGVVTKKMVVR